MKKVILGALITLVICVTAFNNKFSQKKTAPLPTFPSSPQTEFLRAYSPKIVKLTPVDRDNTGGTGFEAISPSGNTVTITNAHVCAIGKDAGQMKASLDDGKSVILSIFKVDKERDLCVLSKIPEQTGLKIAESPAAQYDKIFVIGHPRLLPNTYSEGYVQLNRDKVQLEDEEAVDEAACLAKKERWATFMTFFGPISLCIKEMDDVPTSIVGYPGNSGSPVFNQVGEVVGVVFVGDSTTNYLGYVPLDLLKEVLKDF